MKTPCASVTQSHWSLLLQVFQMAAWRQALVLLWWILNCVESSPLRQRNDYNDFFDLATSTRTRVQQLQEKYKKQQLGNVHFEDRVEQLQGLPLLSTDFYSWLNLTEWERLQAAFWDVHTFYKMLEWKREQLEKEEREQMGGQVIHSTLYRSMRHIQLDLRDLMSQITYQMSFLQSSWTKPTSPTAWAPPSPGSSSKTVWERRVEGYIILRDLDLYLTKLARDFLLLASKTHVTQQ